MIYPQKLVASKSSQSPRLQGLCRCEVRFCGKGTETKHTKKPAYSGLFKIAQFSATWRRGWDSNPRTTCAVTAFPMLRLRPLGHLSALTLRVYHSNRKMSIRKFGNIIIFINIFTHKSRMWGNNDNDLTKHIKPFKRF